MKFHRILSVSTRLSSTTKKTKVILAAISAFLVMATVSGLSYQWYMAERDGWAAGGITITPNRGSVHGWQEVTISNVPFEWEDGVVVEKIVGSSSMSFALSNDGSIYAWGSYGSYSGLGITNYSTIQIPTKIPQFGPDGEVATNIWSTGSQTIAQTATGQLYAWGTNSRGTLGVGSTDNQYSPAPIVMGGALAGKTVIDIVQGAGGGDTTIALTSDGGIYTWGGNSLNGLGIYGLSTSEYRTSPTKSDFPEAWGAGKQAAQIFNNVAVATDGTIYAWSMFVDSCSTTTTYYGGSHFTVTAGTLSGKAIKQLIRTRNNMFAIATDGSLHAYGCNNNALLGNGTAGNSTTYKTFSAVDMNGDMSGKQAEQILLFGNSVTAVADDGLTYYWGNSGSGATATTPARQEFLGLPHSALLKTILGISTAYIGSSPYPLYLNTFLTQSGDIYQGGYDREYTNIEYTQQSTFTSAGIPSVSIGSRLCDSLRLVDATTVTCRTPSSAIAGVVPVDITQGSLSWNIPAVADSNGDVISGYQYEYEFWQDAADSTWYRCGVGIFPETDCEAYDGRYDDYGTHTVGSSQEYPYLIKTAPELAALTGGRFAGSHIKLAPDDGIIDLSELKWMPQQLLGDISEICTGEGSGQVCRPAFINTDSAVTINGFGTTITGLNIQELGYADNGWDEVTGPDFFEAAGLFSEIVAVDIRDLTIDSPVINSQAAGEAIFIGSLAGVATNSRVFVDVTNPDISVTNYIDAGNYSYNIQTFAQGGLIGYVRNNTIVSASSVVGGSLTLDAVGSGNWSEWDGIYKYPTFQRAFVGGLIGYGWKAAVLNNYTDTEVNLNFIDNPNQSDPEFTGVNNGTYFVGGLMGGLSLKNFLDVCLLNNYSRSNITVESTLNTMVELLGAGGLIGYLEDWAVNNYYKGGVISLPEDAALNTVQGALFGTVIDEDNEYVISRNYYDSADGLDAFGGVYGRSMSLGTEYDVITSETDLLDLLQAGRPDAINAMLAHAPEIEPTRAGQARIEHWKIENDQNDGYPIFGRKPYLISVSPDRGPETGGTRVTIEARNLQDDVAILIDGVVCNDIQFISSTAASCTTPPHVPSTVDVTVTSGGESSTFPGGFTYTSTMVITDIRPAHGPIIGGTRVMILGQHFISSVADPSLRSVLFGTGDSQVPCDIISWSDTEIVCTTSAHPVGRVDVTVDNGEESQTIAGGYIYHRIGADEVYLEVDQPGDISLSISPSDSGTVSSGSHDLFVRTNSKYGYRMSISTETNNNSLVSSATSANTLAASGGSISSPTSLSANTWGFATPLNQGYGSSYLIGRNFDQDYTTENSNPSSNSRWAGVPGVDSPVQIKRTWEPIWRQGGDQTSVWYAAKADMSVPVGYQSTTITYTIMAETVPDDVEFAEIWYYWQEHDSFTNNMTTYRLIDYAVPGAPYRILGPTMISPNIGPSNNCYYGTAGYEICSGRQLDILDDLPLDAPEPIQDQELWSCFERFYLHYDNGMEEEDCDVDLGDMQNYFWDMSNFWQNYFWNYNDGVQLLYDRVILVGTNRAPV